jgi:hypothetical protein
MRTCVDISPESKVMGLIHSSRSNNLDIVQITGYYIIILSKAFIENLQNLPFQYFREKGRPAVLSKQK